MILQVCPSVPVANKPNESYPDYKDESQVFVDLGLPSGNLWAKVNVGGTYVYDFGNKYAYGETSPKDSYYNIYYKWYNVDASEFIKYLIDGPKADFKTKLDSEDDVTTVLYGENYHLPSQMII